MSVINEMLRDLDDRNAQLDADDSSLTGLTPVAEAKPSNRKYYLALSVFIATVLLSPFFLPGQAGLVKDITALFKDASATKAAPNSKDESLTRAVITDKEFVAGEDASSLSVMASPNKLSTKDKLSSEIIEALAESSASNNIGSALAGSTNETLLDASDVSNSVVSFSLEQDDDVLDLTLVLTNSVNPFISKSGSKNSAKSGSPDSAQGESELEILLPEISANQQFASQLLKPPFTKLESKQLGENLVLVIGANSELDHYVDSAELPQSEGGHTELRLTLSVAPYLAEETVAKESVTTESITKGSVPDTQVQKINSNELEADSIAITELADETEDVDKVKEENKKTDRRVAVEYANTAKPKTSSLTKASLVISSNDLIKRAIDLFSAGEASKALDLLHEKLILEKPDPRVIETAATIYISQGQYKQAETILGQGLLHGEDEKKLLQLLARTYLAQQKSKEAISILTSQIFREDNASDDLSMLAAAYQAVGEYQKAFDIYQVLLGRSPHEGQWLLGVAINSEYLSATDKAIGAYRQALSSGKLSKASNQFATQRLAILAAR